MVEAQVKEHPILFSSPMVRALLDGRKTQTRRIVKLPNHHTVKGLKMALRDQWKPFTAGGPGCFYGDGSPAPEMTCISNIGSGFVLGSPYQPGDRLWVRETWTEHIGSFGESMVPFYRATESPEGVAGLGPWKPSIFMPRWASRITLEVTEVRVQRLQEISGEDAVAEGLHPQVGDGYGPGAGLKWDGTGYWDTVSTNEFGRTFHVPKKDGICCCHAGQRLKLSPDVCAYHSLWESINGEGSWTKNPWVWAVSFKVVPNA